MANLAQRQANRVANGHVTLALVLLATIAGCRTEQATAPLVELHGRTMGTAYSVKLDRLPEGADKASLQQEIDALLQTVNAQMSTWDPDSELSRFNSSESLDWFPVSAATAEVCLAAKRVAAETGGAFDVTVGPLVNLWNFGPEQYDEQVPSEDQLRQTTQRVGDGLFAARLDPPALKKLHPDVYVDLSAIAKGYGVDVVADFLEEQEVAHYMVEIGGEVRTRGSRGDGKPWRMGIETPTDAGRGVQTVLHLNDAALATSGDYRNYFETGGRRFSHVVDPRSGQPVEHGLASVSVIAEHCIDADAYATALMVLGPESGYNWALSRDMAVLIIIRDSETFIEKSTPGFDLFRKSASQPKDSP